LNVYCKLHYTKLRAVVVTVASEGMKQKSIISELVPGTVVLLAFVWNISELFRF